MQIKVLVLVGINFVHVAKVTSLSKMSLYKIASSDPWQDFLEKFFFV